MSLVDKTRSQVHNALSWHFLLILAEIIIMCIIHMSLNVFRFFSQCEKTIFMACRIWALLSSCSWVFSPRCYKELFTDIILHYPAHTFVFFPVALKPFKKLY